MVWLKPARRPDHAYARFATRTTGPIIASLIVILTALVPHFDLAYAGRVCARPRRASRVRVLAVCIEIRLDVLKHANRRLRRSHNSSSDADREDAHST